MSPTQSVATLRPDLGGSVEEFNLAADREGFIGLKVLPVFEAAVKSGTFGIIPIEELLKNRETRRAPGGTYSRGSGKFSPASYACEEHGTEETIDDSEAIIYGDYINAEMVATERARDIVLRNYEKRVADLIFNAVTFSPQAVTNEWDDVENATPIDDVDAAVTRIWEATGLWPNALIINRQVFRNLRRNKQIRDKISAIMSVLPGDITTQHLQQAFDLPQILVAGGAQNLANEAKDVSISQIWSGEYAAVARVVTGGDLKEPGIGRTMHWGMDGSKIGATIESYRDETVRGNIVRARMDTDEKIIYPGCLDLLSNITT